MARMVDRGRVRALRVSVFSLVCMLLSAAGHAVATGSRPALVGVVAGSGVVVFVGNVLAGRERSWAQISGAVLGLQVVLHAVVSSAAGVETPPAAYGPQSAPVEHQLAHVQQAHAGATGLMQHGPGAVAAMVLGHALAALLAAWWLRRGEALAWRLGRRVAEAVVRLRKVRRRLRVSPLPAGPLLLPRIEVRRPLINRLVLLHTVIRRGPPVAVFVR
jgi:hypothetical protein